MNQKLTYKTKGDGCLILHIYLDDPKFIITEEDKELIKNTCGGYYEGNMCIFNLNETKYLEMLQKLSIESLHSILSALQDNADNMGRFFQKVFGDDDEITSS